MLFRGDFVMQKLSRTTIVDIAKASGVSVSTVSRILNDKPDVAEDNPQTRAGGD